MINVKVLILNVISLILFIFTLIFDIPVFTLSIQIFYLAIIMNTFKKNQILFFIIIFFFIYTLPALFYFGFDITISSYIEYNQEVYIFETLKTHNFFLLILTIFIDKKNKDVNEIEIKIYNAPIIFWVSIVAYIFLIIIGRSGQNIFERGGYGVLGDSGGSALFEYSYIFYLIAYIFSGKNGYKIKILKLLAIIFLFRALLYGARIEIVSIMSISFILFYSNKFKTISLTVIILMAFISFLFFGYYRTNLELKFPNNGFLELYGYDYNYNRITNHETDVYYSSTVILSSINTEFVNNDYRMISTFIYLLRLIIPSSLLNSDYNVVPYLQRNYSPVGGGGLFSSFLYFYGGWLGIFLGAIFTAKIFNNMSKIKTKNSKVQIFTILSISMTPRWFAYSPEAIFKIPLYGTILFIIIILLFRIREKSYIKKELIWK